MNGILLMAKGPKLNRPLVVNSFLCLKLQDFIILYLTIVKCVPVSVLLELTGSITIQSYSFLKVNPR